MAKIEGELYDKYSFDKYGSLFKRYRRMVKEIYNIDEADFTSSKRGNGTYTYRYARVIYMFMCHNKGATLYATGLSINRTSDTVNYNVRCHKQLIKTDKYYKHMYNMALDWDKNN